MISKGFYLVRNTNERVESRFSEVFLLKEKNKPHFFLPPNVQLKSSNIMFLLSNRDKSDISYIFGQFGENPFINSRN